MANPRIWPEAAPTCTICGGVGERIRHGQWRHRLPFGGDGVGPRAHGFQPDEAFIEADRQRKDRVEYLRTERVPTAEADYWRRVGAADVARRSKMEAEWREWEEGRG